MWFNNYRLVLPNNALQMPKNCFSNFTDHIRITVHGLFICIILCVVKYIDFPIQSIYKGIRFFDSEIVTMGLYDDNDQEVVRLGGGWAAATQQVI